MILHMHTKVFFDVIDVFGIGIASVLIAISMVYAYQKKINFVSSEHAYFLWSPKMWQLTT